MKNLKVILLIILSIMVFAPCNLKAQELELDECLPGSERAVFTMDTFLHWQPFEEERVESWTTGISMDQVKPVIDLAACSRLHDIVNGNRLFNEVKQECASKNEIMYFYQTDNFYYIFWKKNPTPVQVPPGYTYIKTGPRTLFIVIKKDFQKIWEFYV